MAYFQQGFLAIDVMKESLTFNMQGQGPPPLLQLQRTLKKSVADTDQYHHRAENRLTREFR